MISSDFSKFDYVKFLWNNIDHEQMSFKATVFEGGYLGKHSNPNVTYSAQVLAGVEPNTSIIKWIFEYDENFMDAIEEHLKEEMCTASAYLESHINDIA